jgi:hypothetical protein
MVTKIQQKANCVILYAKRNIVACVRAALVQVAVQHNVQSVAELTDWQVWHSVPELAGGSLLLRSNTRRILWPALFLRRHSVIGSMLENDGTERRDRVVTTPASYSGEPGFKSLLVYWPSWWMFYTFSSVPLCECWDSSLSYCNTACFQILSNSTFTYRPFFQRRLARVAEKIVVK